MTKEELKQEAGEYASIHARQYCHNDANGLVSSYREVYNAYYQSAEPREERIEKLEKENGNLKAELTKVKQLLAFWVDDFYDRFDDSDKYEERHKALVETEQFLKE